MHMLLNKTPEEREKSWEDALPSEEDDSSVDGEFDELEDDELDEFESEDE